MSAGRARDADVHGPQLRDAGVTVTVLEPVTQPWGEGSGFHG